MDTTPPVVHRNLELMVEIRDTLVNLIQRTATIPNSSGGLHLMPPLPTRINDFLISYLTKNMPAPSSSSSGTATGDQRGLASLPTTFSSSASYLSNASGHNLSIASPTASLFSSVLAGDHSPANSTFSLPTPPPLFSPSSLNAPFLNTPPSGLLSPHFTPGRPSADFNKSGNE